MKRIKIFIASSVEDLRDDRLMVGDFFRQLNEIYIDSGSYFSLIMCQDYDSSSTHSQGQSRYDDEIRDSELCFFLFYRKAEDYTRHEFEIALDSFKDEQKPKIVTYFKTVSKEGEVYPEVLSFMNMLSAELHHYYCKYEHIDTLKLGILMQVKLLKLDRGEITLSDGSIAVKGNPVLSTDNIPVLRGNS